jgi:hypothetical protein
MYSAMSSFWSGLNVIWGMVSCGDRNSARSEYSVIEGSAANSENVGAACGMSCEATSRTRLPSMPQFRTLALAISGILEESTPLVASI